MIIEMKLGRIDLSKRFNVITGYNNTNKVKIAEIWRYVTSINVINDFIKDSHETFVIITRNDLESLIHRYVSYTSYRLKYLIKKDNNLSFNLNLTDEDLNKVLPYRLSAKESLYKIFNVCSKPSSNSEILLKELNNLTKIYKRCDNLNRIYVHISICIDNSSPIVIKFPEYELHPNTQIQIMSEILKVANEIKNKIIVITNSKIITNIINNSIYMGILKNKGINIDEFVNKKKLNIDPESYLNPKDVSAYIFKEHGIFKQRVGTYSILFDDIKADEIYLRDISETLTDEIYCTIEKAK
jgi:hypothetical protein